MQRGPVPTRRGGLWRIGIAAASGVASPPKSRTDEQRGARPSLAPQIQREGGMVKRPARICGTIYQCTDCEKNLAMFPTGLMGSGWQGDWFMVKDSVWRRGQLKGKCRFLCVACLEQRISRKLSATDFRR